MNINATVAGQAIAALVIILTAVGYYLGKRKTNTPVLTAVSLGVSGIVPIVAIVYLIVLINKPDRS